MVNMKKKYLIAIFLQTLAMSHPILPGENGKDLPSNYNFDLLGRKRRPSSGGGSGCNFNGNKGGKYRTDETGRTFFDLQLINVGYHHSYNINCGGGGPPEGGHPIGGGINKPILGGNKPIIEKPIHKPILGGLHQQGGQQQEGQHHEGGLFANRPILSMLLGNRPLQGLFSQSQLQSQSQTGVLSDAISGITSLLPTPQDIGQGFGDGISSFFQTIPQIGQSFQSLLPSFDNFQFPSLPSLPQGGQGINSNIPMTPVTQPTNPGGGMVTPVGPDPITDPDDTIYNDNIKPVHEDHDPVTDPYNNKLPPGTYFNRRYEQSIYQKNKNFRNQNIHYGNHNFHYQQNKYPYVSRPRQGGGPYTQYEDQNREFNEDRGGRGFRFPS